MSDFKNSQWDLAIFSQYRHGFVQIPGDQPLDSPNRFYLEPVPTFAGFQRKHQKPFILFGGWSFILTCDFLGLGDIASQG